MYWIIVSKKLKKTFYNVQVVSKFEVKNLVKIPYHENLLQLPAIFKLLDINTIFSNTPTIRNILIRNSPLNLPGGIYKISCKNCNMFYIGQTGLELQKRLYAHKLSIKRGDDSNALFVHLDKFDHNFNFNEAKIIIPNKFKNQRNILESVIIKKCEKLVVNLSPGPINIDNIACGLVYKEFMC